MGLTGFNRQRKRALNEIVDDPALADKLVAHGVNEPEKLKNASKEDLSFLSGKELKKLGKATQAQEETEDQEPEQETSDSEEEGGETQTTYPDHVDAEKAKEAFDELEDPDFPEHWYSGHYFLSDGSVVKGKEEATQAQGNLNGG